MSLKHVMLLEVAGSNALTLWLGLILILLSIGILFWWLATGKRKGVKPA
jgi:cbb3-type cytochrome oxidase subunit 3